MGQRLRYCDVMNDHVIKLSNKLATKCMNVSPIMIFVSLKTLLIF